MRLRISLSILALSSILTYNLQAAMVDPESTAAHVETAKRFIFSHHLNELKKEATYNAVADKLEVFVAYVWTDNSHKAWVTRLCEDLVLSGFPEEHILFDEWANRPGGTGIYGHVDKLYNVSRVILVGNPSKDIPTSNGSVIHYPSLKEKYDSHEEGRGGVVSQELNILRLRIKDKGPSNIIPTYYEGSFGEVFPLSVQHLPGRFLGLDSYFTAYFDLLQDLMQEHIPAGPSGIISKAQANLRDMMSKSTVSILKFANDIRDRETAAALATTRAAEDILQQGLDAHYPSITSGAAAATGSSISEQGSTIAQPGKRCRASTAATSTVEELGQNRKKPHQVAGIVEDSTELESKDESSKPAAAGIKRIREESTSASVASTLSSSTVTKKK